MPAKLTVIRGRDLDMVQRLDDHQAYVLGRSVKSDIRVPDGLTSRSHCRIQRTGASWTITDAGSRNGTFVNRDRITQATLKSGDQVRVGATVYEFSIQGEPEAGRPGGTELIIEEAELAADAAEDLGLAAVVGEEAPPVRDETRRCAQCGRELRGDPVAAGDATEIGGRLYCSRCVIRHSESDAAPPAQEPRAHEETSESSEMRSLLRSLERATEADRLDAPPAPPAPHAPAAPPAPPKAPPKRPGLLDRLRGRKSPPADAL